DLSCFADGEFDLVVSDIVLQHMPSTNLIKSYISEFLRVLHPGGLAIFQLPSHIGLLRRIQWRRRLYRAMRSVGFSEHLLYERLGLVPMAMRSLPEAAVREHVARLGGELLKVIADNDAPPFASRTYFVKRA